MKGVAIVQCPQCQTEVAAGAATCPNCGAQFAPAAGGPAKAGSFKFEANRLSQIDRITGIASFVLLISLFFPWYSVKASFITLSWDGFWHFWMYFVLVVCLAIIAFLVMKAGLSKLPFDLPLPEAQLLLIATAFNLVLTLLAVLFKPGGYAISGVGWSFGAFLAVIAAVVACLPLALPAIKARRAGS